MKKIGNEDKSRVGAWLLLAAGVIELIILIWIFR